MSSGIVGEGLGHVGLRNIGTRSLDWVGWSCGGWALPDLLMLVTPFNLCSAAQSGHAANPLVLLVQLGDPNEGAGFFPSY